MAAMPHPDLILTILLLAVSAVVQVQMAVASSASYRCGWCPRRSTASLLPPDSGALTVAACGYGSGTVPSELAESGFHIAAVSAGLFRDGQACGACYQLRCRGRRACAEGGVKVVVVSDVPETAKNGTGGVGGRFLLTKDAFAAMSAHPGDAGRLAGLDDGATVDVDFRRIPCVYGDKNLSVKVEEASVRSRGRLALRFLDQGGQTDIAAVEVTQAVTDGDIDSAPSPTTWQYMTRREGSPWVWRTLARAGRPTAAPDRRDGGLWRQVAADLRSDGAVLPADWAPGGVYDTGLRVTDVAASTCGASSCNAGAGDEDGDGELR